MRRFILSALAASALLAAPAMAEPAIKTAMPVIKATLAGDTLGVRMDQGVLGAGRGLEARTVVVVARDAAGRVVAEESAKISRRMTYAQIPLSPAVGSATSVSVSVR